MKKFHPCFKCGAPSWYTPSFSWACTKPECDCYRPQPGVGDGLPNMEQPKDYRRRPDPSSKVRPGWTVRVIAGWDSESTFRLPSQMYRVTAVILRVHRDIYV